MPAADRNASAGYRAVEKIMNGPDYIPASEAEVGLGGLKAMGRGGSGRSQGIAKFPSKRACSLAAASFTASE
jgi:hypothetical protein